MIKVRLKNYIDNLREKLFVKEGEIEEIEKKIEGGKDLRRANYFFLEIPFESTTESW